MAGGIGGATSGCIAALLSGPDESLEDTAKDGAIGGAIDGALGGLGTIFTTVGRIPCAVGRGAGSADDAVRQAARFFDDTQLHKKVLDQLRLKDYHAFPRIVENFAGDGVVTALRGGDGIVRQQLEIHGVYRGVEGVFRFIRDVDRTITHRMFHPF